MNAAGPECRAQGHHTLAGLRSHLSEDILRFLNKSPENQAAGDNLKSRLGAFLTPQLLCLFLYRIAHCLYANRHRRMANIVSHFNFLVHKVNLPPESCIGSGCMVPHPAGVTFRGRAGRGLTLYALTVCCPLEPPFEAGSGKAVAAAPRLGNNVAMGGHTIALGPIEVGDDTRLVFGLILKRDAPAGVLVITPAIRNTMRARSTARPAQ